MSMTTKGVSRELVSMAAVGKVPWRCRRRQREVLAGGVDGEGRGVASNGGGVGGVAKVREVSTVRAEVSAAMAEAQVSGVNDEGVLKVAGVRCR